MCIPCKRLRYLRIYFLSKHVVPFLWPPIKGLWCEPDSTTRAWGQGVWVSKESHQASKVDRDCLQMLHIACLCSLYITLWALSLRFWWYEISHLKCKQGWPIILSYRYGRRRLQTQTIWVSLPIFALLASYFADLLFSPHPVPLNSASHKSWPPSAPPQCEAVCAESMFLCTPSILGKGFRCWG